MKKERYKPAAETEYLVSLSIRLGRRGKAHTRIGGIKDGIETLPNDDEMEQ
jgi:hypothetical protein